MVIFADGTLKMETWFNTSQKAYILALTQLGHSHFLVLCASRKYSHWTPLFYLLSVAPCFCKEIIPHGFSLKFGENLYPQLFFFHIWINICLVPKQTVADFFFLFFLLVKLKLSHSIQWYNKCFWLLWRSFHDLTH